MKQAEGVPMTNFLYKLLLQSPYLLNMKVIDVRAAEILPNDESSFTWVKKVMTERTIVVVARPASKYVVRFGR